MKKSTTTISTTTISTSHAIDVEPPLKSVITSSYCKDNCYNLYHTHSEPQIVLILESNGLVIINGHEVTYQKNDIFIIGAEVYHLFIPNKEFNNISIAVIQFSLDIFQSFIEFKQLASWLSKNNTAIKILDHKEYISILIKKVIEDNTSCTQLISLILLLNRCANINYSQINQFVNHAPKVNTEISRMTMVVHWIDTNSHRPITLTDAINIAYMSKQSFCRSFKKATDKTFITYLTEKRITDAMKLLSETELGITEIAFKVGFNNISSFNRAFKTYNHISPKNYREKILILLHNKEG